MVDAASLKKTAFLVLGAQRSGTSVTSHLLSELGVNFGDRNHFIQFDHNPIFFELDWINAYNNQIIQALGHQYIDFFLPLEADFAAFDATELTAKIEAEWHQAPWIGIKDPRISLTFPIWEKALLAQGYDLKIILAFRHPESFLASNQKLFHNWEGWTKERHLNFWLQLNLAAVYFARHYPIYFLNYDRLIQFPTQEALQLADNFGFDPQLAMQAAQVVQPSHTHHQGRGSTGVERVDRVYHLLQEGTLSAEDYLQFRDQSILLSGS